MVEALQNLDISCLNPPLLLNLGEHLAGAHRFHPPGRPDAGHRGETREKHRRTIRNMMVLDGFSMFQPLKHDGVRWC
jgi:hypothetical protein